MTNYNYNGMNAYDIANKVIAKEEAYNNAKLELMPFEVKCHYALQQTPIIHPFVSPRNNCRRELLNSLRPELLRRAENEDAFALYVLGWPYAILVSVIRVILSTMMFGKITGLIYGLSGAALALLAMILVKKTNRLSTVGVSVVGGVCHNIGQIIAVCIVMGTSAIALNLVVLLITGTIAGVLIGVAAGILIERIKKYV